MIDIDEGFGKLHAMPRTERAPVVGMIYHAPNRGNRRAAVFHKPADYDPFVEATRGVDSRSISSAIDAIIPSVPFSRPWLDRQVLIENASTKSSTPLDPTEK